MSFKLSQRSLDRLDGVHPSLFSIVEKAIQLTKVDFGCSCGVRTIEEQKVLLAKGASTTMKSKHLIQEDGYSHAVDLIAYLEGRVSWELNLYDDIADAMKEAADELDIAIVWGAAWHIKDLRSFDGTMEDAMNEYIDLRRSQGRRPFIDGPHFQISELGDD